MYRYALICTGMYRHVLVCTDMYRYVQTCTGMYRHVPACTDLYRYALTCTGMCRHVPVCTDIYRYVHTFTGMYRLIPVCTDMYRYALTCTGMYRHVPVCTDLHIQMLHTYLILLMLICDILFNLLVPDDGCAQLLPTTVGLEISTTTVYGPYTTGTGSCLVHSYYTITMLRKMRQASVPQYSLTVFVCTVFSGRLVALGYDPQGRVMGSQLTQIII